ncbi:hypothetical protein QWZ16_04470 [Vibrio ostreicida]|uniref:Uncharacterized protein n=1 Tax=Vibrio ostreicida TaxID=526588 RepID=A0ABT8BQP3_9VIBR|nr:hypothetical protein [Vibrio ostreicida]MDN3608979.1 hypothetical protein [Vibrio ostreicida]
MTLLFSKASGFPEAFFVGEQHRLKLFSYAGFIATSRYRKESNNKDGNSISLNTPP